MMKRLSAVAGLSMEYTNHCVRATSITNMKCSGVDDQRICAVLGHNNVQSLEAYDRPTTKDACILADAIDRVAPERSVSPVTAGSSSCVPYMPLLLVLVLCAYVVLVQAILLWLLILLFRM